MGANVGNHKRGSKLYERVSRFPHVAAVLDAHGKKNASLKNFIKTITHKNMGRPRIKKELQRKELALTLPPHVISELKSLSENTGEPVSRIAERALKMLLLSEL